MLSVCTAGLPTSVLAALLLAALAKVSAFSPFGALSLFGSQSLRHSGHCFRVCHSTVLQKGRRIVFPISRLAALQGHPKGFCLGLGHFTAASPDRSFQLPLRAEQSNSESVQSEPIQVKKMAPKTVLHGESAIAQLLRDGNVYRPMENPESLLSWLNIRLSSWAREETFSQKARIRKLEIKHHEELKSCRRREEKARQAYSESALKDKIEQASADLAKSQLEVEGRTKFVESVSEKLQCNAVDAEAEANSALKAKLERSIEALEVIKGDLSNLESNFETLTSACPEYLELQAAKKANFDLKESIGLFSEAENLALLERKSGQRSVAVGSGFEKSTRNVVFEDIIPNLQKHEQSDDLVIIQSVSLGIAKGEIDYMVVKRDTEDESVDVQGQGGSCTQVAGHFQPSPKSPTRATEMKPVLVLAVIEVKNNPNDIGPVFKKYMERLGWMMGEEQLYNASEMVTKHYRRGHFDRPFWHKDDKTGQTFMFDQSSFRLFLSDSESDSVEGIEEGIMKRLHFVTKDTVLVGMGPALHRAIQHQAATNTAAELTEEGDQFLQPEEAALKLWEYGTSLSFSDEDTTEDILCRYKLLSEEFCNVFVLSSSRPGSPPSQQSSELL